MMKSTKPQSTVRRSTACKALVAEFIRKYKKELEEMWETEKYIKLPPID